MEEVVVMMNDSDVHDVHHVYKVHHAGVCGRVAGWPGGRVAGWPGGRVCEVHVEQTAVNSNV